MLVDVRLILYDILESIYIINIYNPKKILHECIVCYIKNSQRITGFAESNSDLI